MSIPKGIAVDANKDSLGPTDGWKSAHIIAMLILGAVLLVVFVFWERVYQFPLMPPHIWKDRNFTFVRPLHFLETTN